MSLSLPYVSQIRTPNFVSVNVDEALQAKCHCGSFVTDGVNWRMWLLFFIQLLFLFLACMIGFGIKNDITGGLGGVYDAADLIRYIGTGTGMFCCLIGALGIYIRKRFVLMSTVVLSVLALIFCFIAWAIDSSNAVDLKDRVAANEIATQSDGTEVSLEASRLRAATAAVFGAIGWLFTIFSTYLTYAFYQEMGDTRSEPSRPVQTFKTETPKPVQAQQPVNRWGQQDTSPSIQQNVKHQPAMEIGMPTLASKPQPIQSKQIYRDSLHTTPKPKYTPKQVDSPPEGMLACPGCGTNWPSDVRFCGECGSQIPQAMAVAKKVDDDEWLECFTEDGYMYYYNTRTGESKWAEG